MKCLGKIAVVLAGGLTLNAGLSAPKPAAGPMRAVQAPGTIRRRANPTPALGRGQPAPDTASSDNPYAAIAVRNIFGLNPPALPTNARRCSQANLPKITPTGIMGVFGNFQVLFKVADPPNRDRRPRRNFTS